MSILTGIINQKYTKNKKMETKAKNEFTKIPGYPKYEVNGTFTIVRSVEKQHIQSLKKGTGKYYLLNKADERKLISMADIKTSLEKEKPKRIMTSMGKTKIDSKKKINNISKSCPNTIEGLGPVKELMDKIGDTPLSDKELKSIKEQDDIKQILEGPFNNHEKVWRLHHKKFNKLQIQQISGISKAGVNKGLWKFNTGRLKSPF